ncbi:hypothetical protein WMF20_15940 [Sorangium sp. So ce834]|uniref:hypothetical protein n=1 Tax=Sorangium sp. So ce834 TaxID=3133321 RepID=UPI003F5FE316
MARIDPAPLRRQPIYTLHALGTRHASMSIMAQKRSSNSVVSLCSAILCSASCTSQQASDESQSAQPLTQQECAQLGGNPVGIAGSPPQLGDPGVDLSRDDECPGSRALKGTLEAAGDANGGICCEAPPSMTFAACDEAGGQRLLDPGDGSSYVAGCEEGSSLIGWLTACEGSSCGEGGICCRP